jgi:hypothetical protein
LCSHDGCTFPPSSRAALSGTRWTAAAERKKRRGRRRRPAQTRSTSCSQDPLCTETSRPGRIPRLQLAYQYVDGALLDCCVGFGSPRRPKVREVPQRLRWPGSTISCRSDSPRPTPGRLPWRGYSASSWWSAQM